MYVFNAGTLKNLPPFGTDRNFSIFHFWGGCWGGWVIAYILICCPPRVFFH